MTTIILAQKLLTMKTNESEFEKVKYELADIKQKKQKIIKSLKVILDQQEQLKLCRLCLKPGKRKIFDDQDCNNIVLNMRAILAIEISEDDNKPQHICEPCEHTLSQAAKLKETAEITQWRLQQELEMMAEATPDWSSDDTAAGCFKMADEEVAREWCCAKCRKVFYSQEEFHEHKMQPYCKAPDQSYICESCGLELKTLSRLKRHRLVHTGALPFACARCAYRGRTRYALAVHARRHSGERPLRCPHCPARFSNASGLASHRRRHLPPRYRCERCQRTFTFRVALENHIATHHSNAKPYNCGFCDKTFSTRKMILRHELKAHNRPKMPSGIMPSYMRQEDVT